MNIVNNNKRGMTLLELLIGIFIIAILIAGGGFQLKGLIHRAKVSAAKTTITGFGLALSMIKDDTGLYPVELEDTKEADAPDGFSNRNWCGPYAMTISLIDPWGNPYEYELEEGIVFGPQDFKKHTPPQWENINFSTLPGKGTIIVENPPKGITAGRALLNGSEIISPYEFQHTIPEIRKVITFSKSNTLSIKLESNPHEHIVIRIISPLNKGTTFILYSKGRNGAKNDKEDEDYDDIKYGDF